MGVKSRGRSFSLQSVRILLVKFWSYVDESVGI